MNFPNVSIFTHRFGNNRHAAKVGGASTMITKNSFLFCIVFGFHYLCSDEQTGAKKEMVCMDAAGSVCADVAILAGARA